MIWSLLSVRLPPPVPDTSGPQGMRRLLAGLPGRPATTAIVGRCLSSSSPSRCCRCPFIGQMPTLADRNLGIAAKSTQYGVLYACFGVGALLGALSIGTVLADRRLERVVRVGLVVFAGFLAVFSLLRAPGARPTRRSCWWASPTSPSSRRCRRCCSSASTTRNRGRVMALWIMGFGGTVPIGNLIAGPLIEATSVTAVCSAGAVVALALAAYADLDGTRPRPPTTPACRRRLTPARRVAASEERSARRSRPATRLPLTRTASPSPRSPSAATASSIDATSSPPYAGAADRDDPDAELRGRGADGGVLGGRARRRARPSRPSTAIRRRAGQRGERLEGGRHRRGVGVVGVVEHAARRSARSPSSIRHGDSAPRSRPARPRRPASTPTTSAGGRRRQRVLHLVAPAHAERDLGALPTAMPARTRAAARRRA